MAIFSAFFSVLDHSEVAWLRREWKSRCRAKISPSSLATIPFLLPVSHISFFLDFSQLLSHEFPFLESTTSFFSWGGFAFNHWNPCKSAFNANRPKMWVFPRHLRLASVSSVSFYVVMAPWTCLIAEFQGKGLVIVSLNDTFESDQDISKMIHLELFWLPNFGD